MVPQQLQKIFGIKDSKDLSMANNIWKMLDQMAESSPQNYKQFVQKNIKQGFKQSKTQKQKAEKPYKIKPNIGFKLEMDTILNQQLLYQQSSIHDKLNLAAKDWNEIKSKFSKTMRLHLNICHSDRVKLPTLKNSKQQIKNITLAQLPQIQHLYYSLQGPEIEDNNHYYCFILNSHIYENVLRQGGKKVMIGLTLSYLEERLRTDKNPLKGKFDMNKYGKNLYYTIEKSSIQLSEQKFKWKSQTQPLQFLLQKQVDTKRAEQIKPNLNEKVKQEKKKQTIEIKYKKMDKKQQQPTLPISKPQNNKKKVVIEVLKETDNTIPQQIPFQMNQTQTGFHFQFLIPGVDDISQVDLEISQTVIKLSTQDQRKLQINLLKNINKDSVKAKYKKKIHKLIVDTIFK